MGLLGPGVCGLGGADTLNIECSLWQDCPCIVPPRVSSDTSAADEGDSIPTLSSDGRFSTIPALTAAPRWRVGWLGSSSFPAAGVGPHDLTICQIAPFPKLPENCDVCGDQLALAPGPHRRHPTPPMPRGRPPTVGEHGRQESFPTRPVTGRRSISTIERRVGFMIVKVGESLGETFGNFVGRLAATLAILTPVIPAFRASVLVVHPVLPDRGHAAMLTMVKDGSWFRLAHRHPSSMAFYRARAGADTLKQDELRAAAGQCSERWRRLGWWDGGCGGSLGVGLRAFQEFHAHFTEPLP